MRIRDGVARHFGEDSVFTDIDSIPLGADFLDYINLELSACDALIAIIGPRWIDAGKGPGQGLHLETDFVRIEVEAALKRKLPVIPALVGGAPMPRPDELPEALRPSVFRNATAMDSGVNFRNDVDRLVRSLDKTLASGERQQAEARRSRNEPTAQALVARSASLVAGNDDTRPTCLRARAPPKMALRRGFLNRAVAAK